MLKDKKMFAEFSLGARPAMQSSLQDWSLGSRRYMVEPKCLSLFIINPHSQIPYGT